MMATARAYKNAREAESEFYELARSRGGSDGSGAFSFAVLSAADENVLAEYKAKTEAARKAAEICCLPECPKWYRGAPKEMGEAYDEWFSAEAWLRENG